MKYEFDLTLVVRTIPDEKPDFPTTQSMDRVVDKNLTGLLAQFQLVLANIHRDIVEECKRENRIIDDDIPF